MKEIEFSKHPLVVLQQLEVLLKKYRELANGCSLIKEIPSEEAYISITLTNPIMDVGFKITDMKLDKGIPMFLMSKKPQSASNTGEFINWYNYESCLSHYQSWIHLIEKYHLLDFNSSIEKEYEEELYGYLEIIDDESNKKPFLLHQQIVILQFLNAVNLILDREEQTNEIADIKNEVFLLTENLPKSTKNQVVRSVSKILSKAFKFSKKLAVEFLVEAKKHIFKELITNGQAYIDDIINIT